MSDMVTIEHAEHGRVEGVKAGVFGPSPGLDGWIKGGAVRFVIDGWREVRPKRWVQYAKQELQGDIRWKHLGVWFEGDKTVTRFTLPEGYRWRAVEIEREVE